MTTLAQGPNGSKYVFAPGTYGLRDRPVTPPLRMIIDFCTSNLPEGSQYIDVGAADGHLVSKAGSLRPFRILCVDPSRTAVEACREAIKLYGTAMDGAIQGVLTGMQLGPADAIGMWRVPHSLRDKVRHANFAAAHRTVVKGGHFFVAAKSNNDWEVDALKGLGKYKPGKVNDLGPVLGLDEEFPCRFFSEEELSQSVAEHGFKILRCGEFEDENGWERLRSRYNKYRYLWAQKI